jgi:hypothetical protein
MMFRAALILESEAANRVPVFQDVAIPFVLHPLNEDERSGRSRLAVKVMWRATGGVED